MLSKNEIDLSVGGMGVKCSKVLKKIMSHEELFVTSVDLRNNQFGNEGIKNISKAFSDIENVTQLRVGSTDIENEGLQALFKSLETNQSISYLSLGNTQNYRNRFCQSSWESFVSLMEKN